MSDIDEMPAGDEVPAGRSGDLEDRLRACILNLLGERGPGKTICPSEAARI